MKNLKYKDQVSSTYVMVMWLYCVGLILFINHAQTLMGNFSYYFFSATGIVSLFLIIGGQVLIFLASRGKK